MVVDKDVADTANLNRTSSRSYVEVVMSKGAEFQEPTRFSEVPQADCLSKYHAVEAFEHIRFRAIRRSIKSTRLTVLVCW
jgi:hypothetical protein